MLIKDLIYKSTIGDDYNLEKIVAYLFLGYMRLEEYFSIYEIEAFIDEIDSPEIKNFVRGKFNKNDYEKFDNEIIQKVSKESIANEIIYIDKHLDIYGVRGGTFSQYEPVSESVVELSLKTVEISTINSAMNFCCGIGTNIIRMADRGIKNITGVELNSDFAAIAEIRTKLYKITNPGYKIEIINNSVFKFSQENIEEKYDLVTVQIPWGVKGLGNQLDTWKTELLKDVTIGRSSDWYFLILAMQHTNKEGKAITLVRESIEYIYSDKEIRRKFVKEGYIERIIQLPANLLPYTSISSLLMVLSFNNNEIEFIDASNSYSEKGRMRYFLSKDIEHILSEQNSYRKIINKNKVLTEERLLPSYYGISKIEESIELGEIAHILRGQNFLKKDLDLLISEVVTNYQLVRTSHLEDGLIAGREYLTEPPKKYEKLIDEDILLTRVSSNKSIAMYNKEDKEVIMVDQSLLIVRVDREKINPYYVLAYFMSKLGKEQLSAAYSGSTIMQISVSNLKKVKIPTLNEYEQEKIARSTKEYIEDIRKKKTQLSLLFEKRDEDINIWFSEVT
ncbi:MAG TPA: N-6 DNA methylase [Clostridiaceae bacterium]|nr:N-6 DNA methylase [Clostridiaceae bacterium]